MNRLEKIEKDLEKAREKAAECQAKVRELEKQKTELENIEIVELVRGVEASPAELAAFIKAFREKNGTPVSLGKEDAGYEANDNDL